MPNPAPLPTDVPPAPDLAVVDDPGAVALLCDPRYLETLAAFLRRELPLAKAAEQLELNLSTLYHRTQRLLGAGLLTVVGHEPRAGRAKPLYRACARALFVPFRSTSFATLDELMSALVGEAERSFHLDATAALERIAPRWGFRLEPSEAGERGCTVLLTTSPRGIEPDFRDRLLGPDTPAVVSSSGTLRLLPEDAKELQRELIELAKRYADRSTPKGTPHHFRFGLAPARERG